MKTQQIYLVLVAITISLGSSINIQSLAQIDIDSMGCDKSQINEAEDSLRKLNEALTFVQTGRLQQNIKELQELQNLVKKGMGESAPVSFIQVHKQQYLSMLKHKFETLSFIQMPDSFPEFQKEEVNRQINLILSTTDTTIRNQQCSLLLKMIEILIIDLLELESEFSQPLTINIEGEIKKIQIIKGQCGNNTEQQLSLNSKLFVVVQSPQVQEQENE